MVEFYIFKKQAQNPPPQKETRAVEIQMWQQLGANSSSEILSESWEVGEAVRELVTWPKSWRSFHNFVKPTQE